MLRKLIRQRKLSTRQALQIYREDQIEKFDDETLRNAPKVDTGVEKVCSFLSLSPVLPKHVYVPANSALGNHSRSLPYL